MAAAIALPGISARTICLCAGSTAAVSLALWLAWPRRAKATREEVLEALEWLRAECAAIFADVAATVARVGVRDSALDAYAGLPEAEENSAKVRQAIEQPLVLQAAMREAASRAAGALPAGSDGADDLEATLQLFSQDSQVQKATGEIQAMHEACLGGDGISALRSQAWSADEVLEVLRQLGRAKAERLGRLLRDAGASGAPTAEGPVLGVLAVRACAEAESEVWGRLCPGDRRRQCSFAVALEQLSSADPAFRERRAEAERELEALAAPALAASPAVLALA